MIRDGKLVTAQTTIGIRSVERVEVLSGIQPGDVVAISPVEKLDDDQTVRTSRIDPSRAAGVNKPAATGQAFKSFGK